MSDDWTTSVLEAAKRRWRQRMLRRKQPPPSPPSEQPPPPTDFTVGATLSPKYPKVHSSSNPAVRVSPEDIYKALCLLGWSCQLLESKLTNVGTPGQKVVTGLIGEGNRNNTWAWVSMRLWDQDTNLYLCEYTPDNYGRDPAASDYKSGPTQILFADMDAVLNWVAARRHYHLACLYGDRGEHP